MGADDNKELRQADLSNLRVQDGAAAELRRRYADFVRLFDGATPSAGQPKAGGKRIRKWVPGTKG